MPKQARTVKDPVQKGRITIGQARTAARAVKAKRSATTGRYLNSKPSKEK